MKKTNVFLCAATVVFLFSALVSCAAIADPLSDLTLPTIDITEADGSACADAEPSVYSSARWMPSTCFYKNSLYLYNDTYIHPTVSGIRTFMKYDLETGEESPVCKDPMCKHDLFKLFQTAATCPFGYGAKPFAIRDDTVYFTTEFEEVPRDLYSERKAYSYNMKNMRLVYLFSYFDGVFGNNVLNMIDDSIYYTDYDVHDDLSVDRYFCVYDLSSGKSERLFKFNSFQNPDTGWIDQIKTETDLSPLFVNGNGEVFFHSKTAVYSAKAEKDAEIVKIKDLGSYDLNLNKAFWRDGKLYFISKWTGKKANLILRVDCSSGKTEIIAYNAALNFTMSGDLLCYWLYDPIELPDGESIVSHSIVVTDLSNGAIKTVDFDYENGFCYTFDQMFLYNERIYLCNTNRFLKKNSVPEDSVINSTCVFDLQTGGWNALFDVIS